MGPGGRSRRAGDGSRRRCIFGAAPPSAQETSPRARAKTARRRSSGTRIWSLPSPPLQLLPRARAA
eukprot:3692111-Pyramimonas_sp.AAC.1